ncbi:MAG TPA: LamB/YcsF family protein [Candidatus Dormibacteraeota bacterium]
MVNLNSDLAEGAGHDEAILASIDSANVCCGVHAGSLSETIRIARRCEQLGIEVGAHPGYDDRQSYGRTETGIGIADYEALVAAQVAALAAIAPIAYVKAHGALYHRAQADPAAAAVLARVAARHDVGLVGQPGFLILAAAEEAGIPGYREGYADRAYQADGSLRPRDQPGAVLAPADAVEQAIRLARSGDYDTICVHGDSPGSERVAAAIRAGLEAAAIPTGHLRR